MSEPLNIEGIYNRWQGGEGPSAAEAVKLLHLAREQQAELARHRPLVEAARVVVENDLHTKACDEWDGAGCICGLGLLYSELLRIDYANTVPAAKPFDSAGRGEEAQ